MTYPASEPPAASHDTAACRFADHLRDANRFAEPGVVPTVEGHPSGGPRPQSTAEQAVAYVANGQLP